MTYIEYQRDRVRSDSFLQCCRSGWGLGIWKRLFSILETKRGNIILTLTSLAEHRLKSTRKCTSLHIPAKTIASAIPSMSQSDDDPSPIQ